ncbi:hypothetical protein HBB16_17895 [Pseudonocardia sp. MCCB 268]|nr:hypothetical protein [Pseudonocardia cytotoxica]
MPAEGSRRRAAEDPARCCRFRLAVVCLTLAIRNAPAEGTPPIRPPAPPTSGSPARFPPRRSATAGERRCRRRTSSAYTGPPDPALRWHHAGECWPGHAGTTAGAAPAGPPWTYEARADRAGRRRLGLGRVPPGPTVRPLGGQVRSGGTGPDNGRGTIVCNHHLAVLRPLAGGTGEYSFLENGAPGEPCAEGVHPLPARARPGPARVRPSARPTAAHRCRVAQRRDRMDPDHIKGFIDGDEWFSFSGGALGSRRDIRPYPRAT